MQTRRTVSVLFTAALCTGIAAAQGASFTPFGSGCAFNQQLLSIGNQGLPQIGTTFTVTYTGPNTNNGTAAQQVIWPHLVIGLGQANLTLPTSFLPQQPAGCTILITPNLILPAAPWIGRGIFHDSVDIPLPNVAALIGLSLYAQWMTTFEQCGFAGCNLGALLTSDAAVMVIG